MDSLIRRGIWNSISQIWGMGNKSLHKCSNPSTMTLWNSNLLRKYITSKKISCPPKHSYALKLRHFSALEWLYTITKNYWARLCEPSSHNYYHVHVMWLDGCERTARPKNSHPLHYANVAFIYVYGVI